MTFGAGSTITVHAINSTMCGQSDHDPYNVAVSAASDKSTFTQLTSGGMVVFIVTSNP